MIAPLAQNLKLPGVTGSITGPLPAGRFTNLASLVNRALLPIIFPIAGILLLLYLIWGGFDYLTSMGDPKKAEAGKTKITQAIFGIFIFFFLNFLFTFSNKKIIIFKT